MVGTGLDLRVGTPVYLRDLDDIRVEVYYKDQVYSVFIVGETIASFLGTSSSFEDCLEEIEALERLVNSEVYRREIERLA